MVLLFIIINHNLNLNFLIFFINVGGIGNMIVLGVTGWYPSTTTINLQVFHVLIAINYYYNLHVELHCPNHDTQARQGLNQPHKCLNNAIGWAPGAYNYNYQFYILFYFILFYLFLILCNLTMSKCMFSW